MFITLYVGLLLCDKDGRSVHLPDPRRSLYTPPVETPAPQRTRTDCTAQAAAQAVPEPGRGKYQGRPCRAPSHTPGHWTRCTGLHSIPDEPRRVDRDGGGRWRAYNPSIMRIMIALSQAWYIDSRLYKYHTNILLHLVMVNRYLSIDVPSY